MRRTFLAIFTLLFLSFTNAATTNYPAPDDPVVKASAVKFDATLLFDQFLKNSYQTTGLQASGLSLDVFEKALTGYYNLKRNNYLNSEKELLTIIDFSKKSTEKRLWIVDLKAQKILYNTLVAHGRNTGENIARNFSNLPNSYMSSIGFYVTNETYFGKHGLSLKLDGMDPEYNSNARDRAIVMHGADYATKAFIRQTGRLGRSLGCPALPSDISAEVIELIKDNTCLYIYAPDKNYTSAYLEKEPVLEEFMEQNYTDQAAL
ncbi:MAG: murein L,D-transpeptidase catalytic domain family protein [Hymenobacteraceae bacterium]|nr:murein L,D-transpeptidase catalytic domain family protein [Hymenobacteraceae bacterium]MDX5394678.1 murein L,D-transpeptidase catalytic domain family protein [Hymenobacteraceae bacterium]MDX5510709.1 murein L,D-transpeptidase catalytic domain family protein [Hymenobacteraceae bacterium]